MRTDKPKTDAEKFQSLLDKMNETKPRTLEEALAREGFVIVKDLDEAFANKRKVVEERKKRIAERKRLAQEKSTQLANIPSDRDSIDG